MKKYQYGLSTCLLMMAFGCSESASEPSKEPMTEPDAGMQTTDSQTPMDADVDAADIGLDARMDLCGDVHCTPPMSTCIDDNTLQTFIANGCDDTTNECVYLNENIVCTYGCFEDACLPSAPLAQLKDDSLERGEIFGDVFTTDGKTLVVMSGEGKDRENGSATTYRFYAKEDGRWSKNIEMTDQVAVTGRTVIDIEDDLFVINLPEDKTCGKGIDPAPIDSDRTCRGSGAIHIFERQDDVWVKSAFIKSNHTTKNHAFGYDLKITNGMVVVAEELDSKCGSGANPTVDEDEECRYSGAIYVYKKENDAWVEHAYLKAPARTFKFASQIEVEGGRVVATVEMTNLSDGCVWPGEDGCTYDRGGVYILDENEGEWTYDLIRPSDNEVLYRAHFAEENKDLLAVTTKRFSDNDSEAFVSIYKKQAGEWTRVAEVPFDVPLRLRMDFLSFAFTGERIFLGNPIATCDDPEYKSTDWCRSDGRVLHFAKNAAGQWESRPSLSAPVINSYFGHHLMLGGDELVVNAISDSSLNTGFSLENEIEPNYDKDADSYRSGALYLFGRAQLEMATE